MKHNDTLGSLLYGLGHKNFIKSQLTFEKGTTMSDILKEVGIDMTTDKYGTEFTLNDEVLIKDSSLTGHVIGLTRYYSPFDPELVVHVELDTNIDAFMGTLNFLSAELINLTKEKEKKMKEESKRPPLYCKEGDRVILVSNKPELQKYNGLKGTVNYTENVYVHNFDSFDQRKDETQKMTVRFDDYPHILVECTTDDFLREDRPACMRISSDPIVKCFEDDLIALFANIFADGFKK